MSTFITRTLPNGEKLTLVGLEKIRFELLEFVIAHTNDKQTEGGLLNLIEELADESEKRGYDRGYHTGFHEGCTVHPPTC
jgi:hypothetical protein